MMEVYVRKDSVMKTLIAYTSKTGTTSRVIQRIARSLGDCVCVDLRQETPNVADYDRVIIGSPIRMGRLSHSVSSFIKSNLEEITTRPYGLFILCGLTAAGEEQLREVYDAALRNGAVACACFGGELNLENLKQTDQVLVQMALDSQSDIPRATLNWDAVDSFIDAFAE